MEISEAKKKKILFCITKSNWGGAQKYVYNLATSISPEKYEIVVVLGGNGRLKEKLEIAGIRTISINALKRDVGIINDIISFFALIKIFKKEKPDIVHLNSSKIGGLGGLAGRIAGIKKIIFTAHGWAHNEDRNFIQKVIISLMHFFTVLFSHSTIVVSEKLKTQLIGKNLVGKKIITIHNSIGQIEFMKKEKARQEIVEKFLPRSESVLSKIKENPVWIGTISELHKNKGLNYAIEGIKKHLETKRPSLQDVIFIIMGEGEERKQLEEIIKKNGLENSVFLVGNVENASSYLKALDIFTLTSVTEALPGALLEAGKAEVPIIASNVGGIPEIIDDMKSGILIQSKKPKEISDAIEYYLNHPDKRESFPVLLKEKIDTEFNLDTMIAKTIAVYDRN